MVSIDTMRKAERFPIQISSRDLTYEVLKSDVERLVFGLPISSVKM